LRSQELNLICGFGTALLLGIGSFVLAATADTTSQDVHMEDVRAFFAPLSMTHLWFYLLLVVVTLYALNTLLCTWDTLVLRVRARIVNPQAYAGVLVHVGLLVAFLAHLVGGLWSREEAPVVVTADLVALSEGRQARLLDLAMTPQADGSLKSVRATLEVRDASGQATQATVGFNEPLSYGLGSEMWLLTRPMRGPKGGDAVMLRHRVAPGNPLALLGALLLGVGTLLMIRRLG